MKKTIKINNKGFMLVEVIIVTVIVATIMTSLYVAFTRVYKVYDMKSKYSNIDGIYALNTIKNYYIESVTINKLINDSTNTFIDLKDDLENSKSYCNVLNIDSENINYCEKIDSVIKKYNINKLYAIDINKLYNSRNNIDELLNEMNVSETFNDYIKYLIYTLDYNNYSGDEYESDITNYRYKNMKTIFVAEFSILDKSDMNNDKLYNYSYLPIIVYLPR